MGGTAVAPQVVQLFTRRGSMRGPRYWWLAALVLIVLASVVLAGRILSPPSQVVADGPAWSSGTAGPVAARRDPRPPPAPPLFAGKPGLAHQSAGEPPAPLDRVREPGLADEEGGV